MANNLVCIFESCYWKRIKLKFSGYAYINNLDMNDEIKVQKFLVLKNRKNKTEYQIRLKNIIRKDVSERYSKVNGRYDWAGFEGELNIMSLNNQFPIEEGTWDSYILILINNDVYKYSIPENSFIEGYLPNKIFRYGNKRYVIYPYFFDKEKNNNLVFDIKNIKMNNVSFIQYLKNSLKKTWKILFKFIYILFKILPVKQNQILFASDSRLNLSGNMKFIYDRLNERELDKKFKFKFLFKENIKYRRNLLDKLKLPYLISTSKFIIIDDFYPAIYNLKLRPTVELIQVWHAVGAFKTFGYSRIGKNGGPTPFSNNHKNYTKTIVSSKEVIKHYAEGFGIDKSKVIPTGIPRTDIFFNSKYKENITNRIHKKYPKLNGKRIITFAPTFRGNGAKTAFYDFNQLNYEKIYQMCKDEFIFIFKMHPFVTEGLDIPDKYKDVLLDFSHYREINDLLFITDILITDYSSTCFEFSLLERPMLFFAYDLEEYISKRDFYYPYKEFVPGKICMTIDDIIYSIENEDFEIEKVIHFKEKFFDHNDGNSTDRVINQLLLQHYKYSR